MWRSAPAHAPKADRSCAARARAAYRRWTGQSMPALTTSRRANLERARPRAAYPPHDARAGTSSEPEAPSRRRCARKALASRDGPCRPHFLLAPPLCSARTVADDRATRGARERGASSPVSSRFPPSPVKLAKPIGALHVLERSSSTGTRPSSGSYGVSRNRAYRKPSVRPARSPASRSPKRRRRQLAASVKRPVFACAGPESRQVRFRAGPPPEAAGPRSFRPPGDGREPWRSRR